MNKKKSDVVMKLKSNPLMGVLIPLLVIMLITQIFNHNFLTGNNMASILKSIPFLALATLGASFPLLIGEIDISVYIVLCCKRTVSCNQYFCCYFSRFGNRSFKCIFSCLY